MATKKGGLGKGISQLFVENAPEDALNSGATLLSIGDIEPDRNQPRTNFDDTSLQELADSIAAHGVLQPILVRPQSDGSYRIVAGERRYRAARMAGLTEVPVVIKVLSDAEAAAIALIENLQREDLNPMEEAIGIKRLMDEFGLTQNETAERLSKSRPAVANALRLLQLPDDCIELVADGTLSAGHARTLLGLENKEMIYEVALTVSEKGMSVRDTEKLVKKLNKPVKETETPPVAAHYHSEVALSLSTVLGRKVNIVTAKGAGKTGGKIEFEFFDDDDLQKLAKLFDN
ncbi:MAG: ParB/RepB/Spo0J family partition protein [Clostridia bacterium]|nr:ParB/RepB/Spo0J family partition protein [Clostridia bacterium]